jgi:hypothetical protein
LYLKVSILTSLKIIRKTVGKKVDPTDGTSGTHFIGETLEIMKDTLKVKIDQGRGQMGTLPTYAAEG